VSHNGSSGAVRLPMKNGRRVWVFDVTCGDGVQIDEVALATNMSVLKKV